MDNSCPFMAIQNALEKSGDTNRAKKPLVAACPFSGKQANLSGGPDTSKREYDFDFEADEPALHQLGAIDEDRESEEGAPSAHSDGARPGRSVSPDRSAGAGSHSPTRSMGRRGSIESRDFGGSFRSVSMAGSTRSGIEVQVPKGRSRVGSQAASKMRDSNNMRRRTAPSGRDGKGPNRPTARKKLPKKIVETTRTTPPPFDPDEHGKYAPLIRSSWGLVLKLVSWEVLGARLYETIFEVAPFLEGMFDKSALTMGIKLVDHIDSIVSSLDDMPAVHRKIEALGQIHCRHGVQSRSHMPVFRGVVVALLGEALGGAFTEEVQAAWAWLWAWLTESMCVVEAAAGERASLIQQSWAAVTEALTADQIGTAVYDSLFTMAPNLKGLFTKPKEIMAIRLVNIVGMLVPMSGSPETIEEVMRDVGTRHVVYGVAPQHLPVMTKAIMGTLAAVLGDLWTPETERAWQGLWDHSSAVMTKAINDGQEHGSAMESIWERVQVKLTKQKFAIQVYSRLTNLNPELVLVFRRAGQTGRQNRPAGAHRASVCRSEKSSQDCEHKDDDHDDDAHAASAAAAASPGAGGAKAQPKFSVRVQGKGFGGAGAGGSGRGERKQSLEDVKSLSSISPQQRVSARSLSGAGGSMQSKRQSMGASGGADTFGRLTSTANGHSEAASSEKKSTFLSMIDTIERVTGLDLDGDGTVGGEVLSEVQDEDDDGKGGTKTRFSKLTWGLEIWDMVSTCMSLLFEPELRKQKLTVIATRFFDYGCRSSHLRMLGEALQGVIGEVLILFYRAPWGPSESSSWDWFWGQVERALRITMDACERNFADVIASNWAAIKDSHSDEEFGNIFYNEIQRVAPDFLCLFVRPRRLQYYTFVQIMETLVEFSQDPEYFYHEVKPLAIRHIKYGVKAEYVKCFSTVVHNVLRTTLGDLYTADSVAAWDYAWDCVSRCIAECLNIGSSLVTVALVTGEVAELSRALSLAPRGQRVDWITRVQIHDSVVSPLYWAIKDGKLDMARVMICDLLTIRADRDAYYYGYDKLWEVHPDLISVVCSICPSLLEDVLDGMLWHSSTVKNGLIRVNYYIRELYGDPDQFPDAWETPFAVLALKAPTATFMHPLVEKIVEVKWTQFARNRFLLMEGWYTIILLLFQVAFVELDRYDCTAVGLRMAVAALALLTLAVQLWLIFAQLRAGQMGHIHILFAKVNVPRWLIKRWNTLRLVSMVVLCYVTLNDGSCLRSSTVHPSGGNATSAAPSPAPAAVTDTTVTGAGAGHETVVWTAPIATASLLLWLGTVQLFAVSKQLSALIFTVGIMVSDVSRVLVVLLIILVAFASALSIVGSKQNAFSSFAKSLESLSRFMLNLDPPNFDFNQTVTVVFLVWFVMFSAIGMLNILIAQLNKTYGKLSSLTRGYSTIHKAQLAVEMESYLSHRMRTTIWERLRLHDPLEFDERYKGPAGGIQCMEPASVMLHPKYRPDRVIRCKGEASAMLPWPVDRAQDIAAARAAAEADDDAESLQGVD